MRSEVGKVSDDVMLCIINCGKIGQVTGDVTLTMTMEANGEKMHR